MKYIVLVVLAIISAISASGLSNNGAFPALAFLGILALGIPILMALDEIREILNKHLEETLNVER